MKKLKAQPHFLGSKFKLKLWTLQQLMSSANSLFLRQICQKIQINSWQKIYDIKRTYNHSLLKSFPLFLLLCLYFMTGTDLMKLIKLYWGNTSKTKQNKEYGIKHSNKDKISWKNPLNFVSFYLKYSILSHQWSTNHHNVRIEVNTLMSKSKIKAKIVRQKSECLGNW